MFEKIKKLWSSNSNVSGSRRSNTKFSRTKSVRNNSSTSFRQTGQLPGFDGSVNKRELTINKHSSALPVLHDGQNNQFDVTYSRNIHGTPTQEFIRIPQTPITGDVRMPPSYQGEMSRNGYIDNGIYGEPLERNNPCTRSTDHLMSLTNDEYIETCRESDRLSLDTSSKNYYQPSVSNRAKRARSFVQLSSCPKQPINTTVHGVEQIYENQSGIYTEVVSRRTEPSLQSSDFQSNNSNTISRERYNNKYSENSSYGEMENKFAKSFNCVDTYSPQISGRPSVGSSYAQSHYASTPMRSTPNIPRSNYNSPRYLHEDVFLDNHSRGTFSTAVSCQRIDELEESLRDIKRKISTSTAIQMQTSVQSENTQQTLLSLLMDKKNEADRLREKVKKLENKLQKQQCEFAEETDKMQLETENIRHKLKLITEKFKKLDEEYRSYRHTTLSMVNDNQKNFEIVNDIKKNYEKEISCLKGKLIATSTLKDGDLISNSDKEILLENKELTTKVIEREEEILKLKEELRLYRSMKSSIGDEEYDDENLLMLDECNDNHTTPSGNSKKKNIVKDSKSSSQQLFSSGSNIPTIYSPSNSSGFGGSQSHGFPNSPVVGKSSNKELVNSVGGSSSTTSMTIQPRVQRIIRDSNEIGVRLRLISRCFSEISSNIVDGKDPEFHKLASRFADSSDSDDDLNNLESNISYNSLRFEDIIRKHQVNIQKAEDFLSQVSSNVLLYATRAPDENKGTCNVQ